MLPGAAPVLRLVRIVPSPLEAKKLRAVWSDGRWTDFGARGYSDYTIHRDKERRRRYRIRHARDPIDDPRTAGALSWHLLWGESVSLRANIRAFRARFQV